MDFFQHLIQVIFLAFIQGMAELLPVSSSAHVIVAEKLMGLEPQSPEMTFLLIMLHTGTMFAVLYYFKDRWKQIWKTTSHKTLFQTLFIATALTGVVGLGLKKFIEVVILNGGEIEEIFGNLKGIGSALFAAGLLILIAGKKIKSSSQPAGQEITNQPAGREITNRHATLIGIVQGLCLPFRGFSRSGATISVGVLAGLAKNLAEDFSFALAVILTPPIIVRYLLRLIKAHELSGTLSMHSFLPGLIGMLFSFIAGLLALRWLSNWIEKGHWHWFGYYCLMASAIVFILGMQGF